MKKLLVVLVITVTLLGMKVGQTIHEHFNTVETEKAAIFERLIRGDDEIIQVEFKTRNHNITFSADASIKDRLTKGYVYELDVLRYNLKGPDNKIIKIKPNDIYNNHLEGR